MEEKKKIVIIITIIIILLIAIGIIITIKSNSNSENNDTNIYNIEEKKEEFKSSNENLSFTIIGEKAHTYVSGTITNLTENIYQDVKVECILYGENGEELEKVYGKTYFLEAHKDFKFFAFSLKGVQSSKVKSYSVSKIEGTMLPKEKNITKDFSIYNEKINAFYNSSPTVNYNIKNISNIDYQEPITIVQNVKSNTGITYTYYKVLNSLKPNATTECYTSDNIGTEPPEYKYETKNITYSFENSYVILGDITNIEGTKIRVPFIKYITWEEAKQKLETMNLKAEKIEQPSETIEKNYVISQSPEMNTKVETGSTIKVYISAGNE